VLDIESSQVSRLAGSEGMWSPSWSPDGRFLAGLSARSSLLLYDFETRRQTELSGEGFYPSWSADGKALFFGSFPVVSKSCWRIRIRDGKAERFLDMEKHKLGTDFGWFLPATGNQIITTRGIGTQEIYALEWEAP